MVAFLLMMLNTKAAAILDGLTDEHTDCMYPDVTT